MREGSVVLGRRLPLKDESSILYLAVFSDARFADPVGDGKSLKPAPIDDRRCGHDKPSSRQPKLLSIIG